MIAKLNTRPNYGSWTQKHTDQAVEMRKAGHTQASIGAALGFSHNQVGKVLRVVKNGGSYPPLKKAAVKDKPIGPLVKALRPPQFTPYDPSVDAPTMRKGSQDFLRIPSLFNGRRHFRDGTIV